MTRSPTIRPTLSHSVLSPPSISGDTRQEIDGVRSLSATLTVGRPKHPQPAWRSKISLFYKILGALLLTFALAGFTPKSILGQSCGSLFSPARSTLHADFGSMMNQACSEALRPRLAIVVITAILLIVMVGVLIKAGFEELREGYAKRTRRERWRGRAPAVACRQ